MQITRQRIAFFFFSFSSFLSFCFLEGPQLYNRYRLSIVNQIVMRRFVGFGN